MNTARRLTACALLALVVATGAGCGSGAAGTSQAPTARLKRTADGESVMLTPLGAARIGVRTAAATARGADAVVPYSALLYEPDGTTAVYVNTGPLAYTRYIVVVGSITSDQVDLTSGLRPGAAVVTVGAEELLGVQNGVGEET